MIKKINIRNAFYTNTYVELIWDLFVELFTNGPRLELIFFLFKNRAKNDPQNMELASQEEWVDHKNI